MLEVVDVKDPSTLRKVYGLWIDIEFGGFTDTEAEGNDPLL